MDKKERKGLAIGAAVGAVLGVITGILFAPQSGKETRKDIKNAADKTVKEIQHEAAKLQEEIKELIAKAESVVKNTSGKTSEVAKKHIETAKHTASNLGTVAKSFKAGKASDQDLDDAIQQVKSAKKSIETFLKK